MILLWIALGIVGVFLALVLAFHIRILIVYIPVVIRIFQEKPLFILPFGQPVEGAEEVELITADGLTLKGCYLKTSHRRKGVILFGPEFGSNRWGCVPYCQFLLEGGYDIFSFEMRGQGQSPAQAGYEPLQWLTEFEIEDFQTALEYLKNRPDADPRGIGLFGLSKGGSAGLWIAANDPWIRCCVTDGAFATLTTMLPYMKQWIYIYTRLPFLVKIMPHWYFVWAAHHAMRKISRIRKAKFPDLESVLPRLGQPWLMIHGGADNYIKPDMARQLLALAREPKELWIVEKAKHNQSMQTANGEYQRRVLEFFDKHLGSTPAPSGQAVPLPSTSSPNGSAAKERASQPVANN